MAHIWSEESKFMTHRRLWVALAQAEHELGLPVSASQVEEMKAHVGNINWDVAEAKEKEIRHDVMAHIHAFGEQCPSAAPIIHLGATSCFVGDNTDLLLMRDSLQLIQALLLQVIVNLRAWALEWKSTPTLGFTHFQPAQLTTIGKRATLWLQDFVMDFHNLQHVVDSLRFRGVKGTTGTQASFLALFNDDHSKVRQLDARVCELMNWQGKPIGVAGQTYSRKQDYLVLAALSSVAQSAAKMGTDVRLLSSMKEVEEPFEAKQVGSSAMAYKRNPMRSERMCGLARFVMSMPENAAQTAASQWFERTLDDSANRRLSLPESFLGTEAVLKLAANISSGMKVWPRVVEKHVQQEIPFMATENILMAAVHAGGSRQDLHEVIREHSMEAGKQVKEHGGENDLLTRLKKDPAFASVASEIDSMVDASKFVGRAPEQVDEYIAEEVDPIIKKWKHILGQASGEIDK
jgi:adenylosuccinate lyase